MESPQRCFWRQANYDIQGQFLPRCSHTCVQAGKYFYVIGGGVFDPTIGDFKHYNDVWRIDPTAGTMKQIEFVNGNIMKPIRGHTASVYKDCIYVFGGLFQTSDMIPNDVPWEVQQFSNKFYKIDIHKNVITELPCSIIGRRGHAATVYNDKLFIIGGEKSLYTPEEKTEIYAYNLLSHGWSTYSSHGKLPQQLSLVINDRIDDIVYFYVDETKLNMSDLTIMSPTLEIYSLNLNTLEWRSLTSQNISDDRFCSVGKFINDDLMVIFGGSSTTVTNKYLNDILILNNKSILQPTELLFPTIVPPSRNGMTFTPLGSSFLMIGGGEYRRQYWSDIWILDLMPRNFGLPPSPRNPFLDYYENLLETKLFLDVSIIITEKKNVDSPLQLQTTLQAHRIVLASRCEYFDKMLSGKFSETKSVDENAYTTIRLNDVKISAFQYILYFIYTGRVDAQWQQQEVNYLEHTDYINHIVDCLELASMLNFTEFIEYMENILLAKYVNPLANIISSGNVTDNIERTREMIQSLLELLVIAHNNDLQTLMQVVFQYIQYITLFASDKKFTLSDSPLYAFVDFENLKCYLTEDILERLLSIMTYAQANNFILFKY